MLTENTSLKNITPTGDYNTTHEMVIGKSNTYQRQFLIAVAGSFALLVLFAVACKTAGYSLVYTGGLDGSDTANLALTRDIFDFGAAENDEGCDKPGACGYANCCGYCCGSSF